MGAVLCWGDGKRGGGSSVEVFVCERMRRKGSRSGGVEDEIEQRWARSERRTKTQHATPLDDKRLVGCSFDEWREFALAPSHL